MRFSILGAMLSLSLVGLLATSLFAAPITGNGPGGVGDPTVAGELRLWVRGDQGVQTSGGFVTQWDDQSAYGSNLLPDNAARRPLASGTQNGNSVVTFNPANPLLPTTAPSTVQFLRAPNFVIGGSGSATTYGAYVQNDSRVGLPFFARSPVNWFGIHSNGEAGNYTHTAYTQGAGAGATTNGVLGGSTAVGSWTIVQGTHANVANAAVYTDFTFGSDAGDGATRLMNGQSGEVVVYNTALSVPQQYLVQNYLSSKYDRAIGAIDRYDGDTAGNGNYDLGVFGVIDVAGVSVINGGMDGFGIEATPGTNQSALAGHKVANNSIQSNIALGDHLYASTWERSWYVDSDETFGATIGFDSVDAGLGALDNSQDYFVLFRDTEVGDWSVLGEGTVNGDLVTFNVGNLLSGYYTLAFNITYLPEPSSLTILGLGAICLGWRNRRRSREARA